MRVKPSLLETRCGGRLFKWLKHWASRLPPGSTPWPGWPASRLIPEPFSLGNCSSRYTDRVTMDTVLWPALWLAARRLRWWRGVSSAEYPEEIRGKAVCRGRHARRLCSVWPLAPAKSGEVRRSRGTADRRRWRGRWAKPPQKKFSRRFWARGSRVLKTQGNLNNEYGLPLTLLKLDDEHDAAVVEMGMSHSGRTGAADEDRVSRRGSGDARCGGAFGVFRVDGRDCAGRARTDRESCRGRMRRRC